MNALIHPARALTGVVDPPSSKNYTTRYLLVSSLARGESRILRPALSEDAVAMVECVRTLGARVRAFDRDGEAIAFALDQGEALDSVQVIGFAGRPHVTRADGSPVLDAESEEVDVNPHNAGAVLRLLLGVGALLPRVRFVTDHRESLGRRPNRDLLEALGQLGVEWNSPSEEGTLPIVLWGGRKRIETGLDRLTEAAEEGEPPTVEVSGAVSSQYVSSLLFLSPLLGREIGIRVSQGLRSKPLVETTLEVMRDAGVRVDSTEDCRLHRVMGGQAYSARRWPVHGDWPGAAALLAAAAVVPGSRVTVERLYDDLQGERLAADLLGRMGCRVERFTDSERGAPAVTVGAPEPGEPLRGIDIDGDECTDAVLALYAASALAEGETRIFGIRNLQFKECDRIREPLAELKKVYATRREFQRADGSADPEALEKAIRWYPEENPDEVVIRGCPEGFAGGIEVDGCGDHRVVMMLSIVGLRCEKGLSIEGAEAVAKSYPRWFEDLGAMGAEVEMR